MLQPTPELRHLVYRVVAAVRGDGDVGIEQIQHLPASLKRNALKKRVYISRFDAQYLPGFRMSKKAFANRALYKVKQGIAQPVPPNHVIARPSRISVSIGFSFAGGHPLLPEVAGELLPGALVNRIGAQKLVGHHRTADIASVGKDANGVDGFRHCHDMHLPECLHLGRRQKDFPCHVIAVFFNLRLNAFTADAGSAKP